ncbi:cyclohexanecarboxylate-CoA ligase [Actinoplanes campanulatus]|uniref:Cyclohexanecarboxylate-CoA ligase n=1 Tax=Actinoplanes campanulatus TaxID=113559 RepID=A0A7W5ALT3_9ACTN|nr:AMP-binding protein [Actinoplanes campanulatus]MBB3098159.1 cyclohexanecarboxylate-CoA ligase [Actinoplanes campanulatus]GGN32702.1 cyclohexanecarboxylate-CoA ligase [Actinoplanes campanulatus]GID39967.1 cyclohexanecarboxylate-CoA ligase [Actinoplanes campanulatus]
MPSSTVLAEEQSDFAALARALRPPPYVADRFYAAGWWRRQTILHDLYLVAARYPDRPAFLLHQAAAGRTVTMRYAQLVQHVDRFARALLALGVRRGDPVVVQLPNSWEAIALLLACLRAGAVAVPVSPSVRQRELERVLRMTQATVCVVPDQWHGFPHAEALAEVAPRLLWLRHRVVLGDAAATGAIDFAGFFVHTWHDLPDAPHRLTLDDPDRASMVVFTSGSTGEMKAVLHSHNTFRCGTGAHAAVQERGWGENEVFATPFAAYDTTSLLFAVWGPILSGGTGIFLDRWDPEVMLDVADSAGVTQLSAAPPHWQELAAAQRRRPRALSRLRTAITTGAAMRPAMLQEVSAAFGKPMHRVWGMTETGMGIRTRPDAPPAADDLQVGYPVTGLETDLVSTGEADEIFPMRVRGPSVCLGVWHDQLTVRETWKHDDGWFSTGDLVTRETSGAMRIAGRVDDRIGHPHMIPVQEVEMELARHPAVREVAVVGYVDQRGGERPCAVVVPHGVPPTLTELRDYLTWRGMTGWYRPTRLEVAAALPRSHVGKIRKDVLRRWIAGAEVPD